LGLLPSSDDGRVISTNHFHPIDSVTTTESGYTDCNDECQQRKERNQLLNVAELIKKPKANGTKVDAANSQKRTLMGKWEWSGEHRNNKIGRVSHITVTLHFRLRLVAMEVAGAEQADIFFF
jgi:hypothetical protein